MVTTRQLRWIHGALGVLQGVLVCATIWVLAAAATNKRPQFAQASMQPEAAAQEPPRETLKPLSWYAPLWQRDWRQPPLPPSIANRDEQKAPPHLPHLLGTFLEAGQSYAHFRTHDGKTRLAALNGLVGGYEVTAIKTDQAILRHGDETYRVDLPKKNGAADR